MKNLESYEFEILQSLVSIIIYFLLRYIFSKTVRKIAQKSHTIEQRTNLVIKYITILLTIILLIVLIVIWGVDKKNLLLSLTSIGTIIGVGMFAQWSILSNITSGIILFFFFPFKIGDYIKIHDKDFPMQGEIIDISAFHITLLDKDGTIMTYPNNLLLQKGISIVNDKFLDKEFFD